MVTIEQMRAALGPAAEGRTDEQLAELRERYYALGRIVINAFRTYRTPERLLATAAARRAELEAQSKRRP